MQHFYSWFMGYDILYPEKSRKIDMIQTLMGMYPVAPQ